MTDRKYVRVYYDILREYPEVCADDAAFGTWVRLLMVADAMYPGVAHLPRSTRTRPLLTLVDAGLVLVTGDTYTVRGLDAERTRRGTSARNAAALRWHSDRSSTSDAKGMPRRDETRRDETSTTARDGLPNLNQEAVAALEERTGETWGQAGQKQLGEYDRLVGRYGLAATLLAFDRVRNGERMTARQLVWGAVKVLEPFVDPKAAAKAERDAEVEATNRRELERTQRYLAELRGEA